MNEFTIYCTTEQIKKALQVGAPIELRSEYYHPTEHDLKLDNPIPCESYTYGYHYAKCPTAEQMIGWLEAQGEFKVIAIHNSKNLNWSFHITTKDKDIFTSSGYSSRKQATLAAIDAALEHLNRINGKARTTYIPIPKNEETQRQVMAILAIQKMKDEFNKMSDEEKKHFLEQYEDSI